MNPLVSVVVPVHNAEAYLGECIDSLLAQTLREMEFLFVDDGSTDGSVRILSAAAQKDSRVRVLTMKENRGVSAARNLGIDVASGAWIGFCDADDRAEPELYGALLEACRKAGADVGFCRVFKDRPSGTEDVPLGFPDGTVFNRAAIRTALIPAMLATEKETGGLPLSGYSPRNLFRRETVGDIRYREDIRYAEDLLFIVTCMLRAESAVALDKAYYHYRFHRESTTKRYSPYVPDSLQKSNEALACLLQGSPSCMRRMLPRRRKMAVDAVRNFCAPGTPYPFAGRVRAVRAFVARKEIRDLFAGLSLRSLPPRLAVQYGLVKWRCAFLMTGLYSAVFRRRA